MNSPARCEYCGTVLNPMDLYHTTPFALFLFCGLHKGHTFKLLHEYWKVARGRKQFNALKMLISVATENEKSGHA